MRYLALFHFIPVDITLVSTEYIDTDQMIRKETVVQLNKQIFHAETK